MNSVYAYSQMLEEKVEDLENKIINLERENFELRQKLNTTEECCVLLEKKVKKLKSITALLKETFNIKLQKKLFGAHSLYIYYAGITIEKYLTDIEYDLVKEVFQEDE